MFYVSNNIYHYVSKVLGRYNNEVFAKERDWKQLHSSENLAMVLSVEVTRL